jgi:hypothetical protein
VVPKISSWIYPLRIMENFRYMYAVNMHNLNKDTKARKKNWYEYILSMVEKITQDVRLRTEMPETCRNIGKKLVITTS